MPPPPAEPLQDAPAALALSGAVTQERIRLAYGHEALALSGNLATCLVLALLLWEHAARTPLLAWLAANVLVAAVRGVALVRFRREAGAGADLAAWAGRYVLTCGVAGSLWGLAGVGFFAADPAVVVILVILIAGVVSGSLGSASSLYPAYLAFALAAVLPFAARSAFEGGLFHWVLAGASLLFLAVNAFYARNMYDTLVKAIRLRLENQALVRELTRQKEIAEAARLAAEQANLAKSKFLASASHDLRQPVYALGLFIDALEADFGDGRHRRMLENMKSANRGLEELLNALLDFSRIDAGALQPRVRDFQINGVLQRLAGEFAAQARAKGLYLRVVSSSRWVRSDPALLERMLRNLVANAVRYTDAGCVLVGCRWREGSIRIEVRDTGPGIPAHLQQEVFRDFYQIGNPERDRSKGLGLGLAIVDGLARLLEHPLELRSREGVGSIFALDLPAVAPAAVPPSAARAREDFEGAAVLVIDDDPLVREAVTQVLERWNCRVLAADSAAEAIAGMAQSGFRPEVMLVDYRLRENRTGVEAIRELEAALGGPVPVPAAIVTGDTSRERLIEAKSSGYPLVHKPLNGAKLRNLLASLLQGEGAPA